MEEAPRGSPPRGVPGQQVLAHRVVVVVHGNPGTKRVLGEGQAGLPVALLEAALIPNVVALWLICRWTEKQVNLLIITQIRRKKIQYSLVITL